MMRYVALKCRVPNKRSQHANTTYRNIVGRKMLRGCVWPPCCDMLRHVATWKWRVIIAVNFQFKQLERRSLKKIRASTGFEPVNSATPVRCSTNWAMKPHIGREVNLLSSYLPVQWNDAKFIWNNSYLYCRCRWQWRVIIAVNFTGRYELDKLTSLPMCGFIAQVEHRTGIAEVTGSNLVEALIFFRLLLSNC